MLIFEAVWSCMYAVVL